MLGSVWRLFVGEKQFTEKLEKIWKYWQRWVKKEAITETHEVTLGLDLTRKNNLEDLTNRHRGTKSQT